ncbi:MAG: hypothetical protein JWN66_3143 [Sphingomonas bacterium]|jgi:hypothetical protein|uniref:hypothetical protein n=1 Tax=Sphingomonas bacterium TaxID=1895847 RepID=UPI00260A469C|nr:hypothetical protein [Sphingomonas bacterium]MDB5706027.1 hypothetical protein [Sphingomonas bacterium]
MAKADRLARLDEQRVALEADYHALLVAALRRTAGGKWGLFGHHQDRWSLANVPPIVAEIEEAGEEIDRMREQLSIEPFKLHQEFLASRGPVNAHAVGEPKQAQAWLDRLEAAGSLE